VLRILTDSIIAGRDKYVTTQAEMERARAEDEARTRAAEAAAKEAAAKEAAAKEVAAKERPPEAASGPPAHA